MGAIAANEAIKNANLSAKDIDLIITTSLSFDKICPSTASIIQALIEADQAAAFDLSSACAGFTYGLTTAFSFIESNSFKNVLLIGAENISKIIDWSDRNTCVLFGDGAGATVISEVEKGYGHIASYLSCDGSKSDLIEVPAGGSSKPASKETIEANEHYLKMKGKEVFKFAVRAIPDAINNLLEKVDFEINDIDLFIPHQANIRIIESASKKLGIHMNKFYTNLETFGNTSTASVPIALKQAKKEGLIKKGSLIVLIGFGGGLSWGANLVRWSN